MPRTTSFAVSAFYVRRWDRAIGRWLFSLGFLPDRDASLLGRAYAYYTFALGGVWLFASWGGLLTLTLQASRSSAVLASAVRAGLPAILALALIVLITTGLAHSPLSLTAEDAAYVAPSPLPRRTLALVRFLPSWLGALAFFVPASGVLSVLASASPAHYLLAMAAVVPLTLGGQAAAWAVGLLRMSTGSPWLRGSLWLMPAVLLAGISLRLPAALAPGIWLRSAATGGTLQTAGLLWFAGCGVLVLIAAAGSLDLKLVVDESLRRAYLRSIDAGRRYSPAAAAQQKRAAILSRRRARGHLPTAGGAKLLLARAALARLRYPAALWPLLRTAILLSGGLDLAILPTQGASWLAWLLVIVVYPPSSLAEDYASDARPFLRQFMPVGSLRLVLVDALLPAGCIALAGVLQITFLPLSSGAKASAVLLLISLIAVATVSQALRESDPDTRASRLPAPDVLAGVIGYGLFIWLGVAKHEIILAALAMLVAAVALARLLEPAKD